MKRYQVVILLVFFCIFYYGCRKNSREFLNLDKTFIEEVKQFFSDSIMAHPSASSAGITNQSDLIKSLKKTPVWTKAELKTISLGKAVVIPLSYETMLFGSANLGSPQRISIEEVTKLLIYKDVNNQFKVELVNAFPDENFLSGKSKLFTGIITVEKWNGDFLKGFKYERDKILAIKKSSEIIRKTDGVKTNYIVNPQRYCYWEDWYRCINDQCTLITSVFLGCDDTPDPPSPESTAAGDYQQVRTPAPVTTPCPVTVDDLKAAFPGASNSRLNSLVSIINKYSGTFGLNTKEKIQMFLAQAAHETSSFTLMDKQENLYYTTPERIAQIWPKRFSMTDPNKKNPTDYLQQPEKLGEAAYFGRLGNNNPGDGYKYRGRGFLMLTGKENYTAFKNFYNNNFQPPIDPVGNPDAIISDFTTSILSAMFFFKAHVLDQMAIDDNTDIVKVTLKINGGTIGLPDRRTKLANAKLYINCH